MSNDKNSETKICPYCSHEQPIEALFCQKCGKPFPKDGISTTISSSTKWRQVKKRITQSSAPLVVEKEPKTIVRTCPKCSAMIESTILEQCPLCMEILPPLPPDQKENLDRILFTGKKLVSEKEIKIDRNKWTSGKEILNVSLNSVMIYIFIIMAALIFERQGLLDANFFALISLLGTASLGIFPLIYVAVNHLNWKKIGLSANKVFVFIVLGVALGFLLYFVDFGLGYLLDALPIYPPESILAFFFNEPTGLIDINAIDFPLRIAFYAAYLLSEVFEEILFRGVVQNGIFDIMTKKKRTSSHLMAVILTTLLYAGFYLLFGLSGYILIFNIVLSLIVGITYELSNHSLAIALTMKTIYVGLSILFFFIPLF